MVVRNRRLAVVALGAAIFGALAFASPAAADITTTPSEVVRGGGVKVSFQIPEDRPGAHTTKVELVTPRDTVIGEVYPMSSNDWAPQITTRRLDAPVAGLHGGPMSDVTDRITWIRVAGTPVAEQPSTLVVSMGPMPVQGDQVVFQVVQTYSDGTVVDHPGTVIKLTGQAVEGGGHHGGAAPAKEETAAAVPAASTQDTGGSYGILIAGLLAGLGLGAAGCWLAFRRRGVSSLATPPAVEADKPKAAATH
ncbi:DUF1775 domain-containing protein [Micromonospora sp. CPCC 206061]|uniref:DUF1775 domain-containing protein n=1 Tax=Micromonospora sp. CPCC 206061 TaxID=3122410 RepID=UPI002FF244CF